MDNFQSDEKRTVLDVFEASFHALKSNEPTLVCRDGRVYFIFTDDDLFRKVDREYHSNSAIPCIDYGSAIRRLRAAMMAAKSSAGRR